jgi:hypothetical protein
MNNAFRTHRLVTALGIFFASLAGIVPQAPAEVVAVAGSDGTSASSWTDIKNDTYSQRAHFAAGAERLSAALDRQVALLKAKRAAMTTDSKDWDFAMKEVDDSRSFLTSRMTEMARTTTPETWAAAKEKVGEAWRRSQLAVDKMNATVTS